MAISESIRQAVRHRAGFACEYCGVTETQVGGELTIDHYVPQSQGGPDDLDNLVYCCARCNSYKGDYWRQTGDLNQLWHPRQEPAALHYRLLENGEWRMAGADRAWPVDAASAALESPAVGAKKANFAVTPAFVGARDGNYGIAYANE